MSYAAIVRRRLVPELGRIRLVRLAPADVQAMMNRKRAVGLSARGDRPAFPLLGPGYQ